MKDFALVGGTALSLRLGHRRSIDIDLFTPKRFDPSAIAGHIDATYQAKGTTVVGGTIFSLIEGVKTDLLFDAHPWARPPETLEGVRMASIDDIAAMKIHAVVNNGTRLKDYIDVHHLLEKKNLTDLLASYIAKYPAGNASIAKNALLYHKEIDFQKGHDYMSPDLAWKDVAKRLKEAVAEPKKVFQPRETIRTQENKPEGLKRSKGLRKGNTP